MNSSRMRVSRVTLYTLISLQYSPWHKLVLKAVERNEYLHCEKKKMKQLLFADSCYKLFLPSSFTFIDLMSTSVFSEYLDPKVSQGSSHSLHLVYFPDSFCLFSLLVHYYMVCNF